MEIDKYIKGRVDILDIVDSAFGKFASYAESYFSHHDVAILATQKGVMGKVLQDMMGILQKSRGSVTTKNEVELYDRINTIYSEIQVINNRVSDLHTFAVNPVINNYVRANYSHDFIQEFEKSQVVLEAQIQQYFDVSQIDDERLAVEVSFKMTDIESIIDVIMRDIQRSSVNSFQVQLIKLFVQKCRPEQYISIQQVIEHIKDSVLDAEYVDLYGRNYADAGYYHSFAPISDYLPLDKLFAKYGWSYDENKTQMQNLEVFSEQRPTETMQILQNIIKSRTYFNIPKAERFGGGGVDGGDIGGSVGGSDIGGGGCGGSDIDGSNDSDGDSGNDSDIGGDIGDIGSDIGDIGGSGGISGDGGNDKPPTGRRHTKKNKDTDLTQLIFNNLYKAGGSSSKKRTSKNVIPATQSEFTTNFDYGVIVIHKNVGAPVLHDLRPLVDMNYIVANDLLNKYGTGLTEKMIRRFATCEYVPRKSADACIVRFAKPSAKAVVIFETCDGENFRIMGRDGFICTPLVNCYYLTRKFNTRRQNYNLLMWSEIEKIVHDETITIYAQEYEKLANKQQSSIQSFIKNTQDDIVTSLIDRIKNDEISSSRDCKDIVQSAVAIKKIETIISNKLIKFTQISNNVELQLTQISKLHNVLQEFNKLYMRITNGFNIDDLLKEYEPQHVMIHIKNYIAKLISDIMDKLGVSAVWMQYDKNFRDYIIENKFV